MKQQPNRASALALSLLIVSTLIGPTSCAAAKVLRWRLEPEQKYRVVVDWTSRNVMAGLDVSNTTMCDLVWTVKSVDAEGRFEIAQSLAHVKQNLQTPDGTVFQYDSKAAGETKGTTAFLAAYWKPLLGVERAFKMTPQGEVLDGEDDAKNLASVDNALVSRAFGRDAWRDALHRGSVVLPAEGLEPNQAWTEPQTVALPNYASKLTVTRSYTYEGERQQEEADTDIRLDIIKVTNRFEIEANEEKPLPLRIIQQNGAGEIVFDGAAGRLVSSTLDQTLKLRYQSQDRQLDSELTTAVRMTFQPLPRPAESPGDASPTAASK